MLSDGGPNEDDSASSSQRLAASTYAGDRVIPIYIDSQTTKLKIILTGRIEKEDAYDFVLNLTDPDGNIIKLDENVEYYMGYFSDSSIIYIMENPGKVGYWSLEVKSPDEKKYILDVTVVNGIYADIKSHNYSSYLDFVKENSRYDYLKLDDESFAGLESNDWVFSGVLKEVMRTNPAYASPLPSEGEIEMFVELHKINDDDFYEPYRKIELNDDGVFPDKQKDDGFYAGLARDLPEGSYTVYINTKGMRNDPVEYFEQFDVGGQGL